MSTASKITSCVLALECLLLTATATAQTDNTATGFNALMSNTTGDYNTATGSRALRDNTSGSQNTATGRGAMYKNTSGNYNVATGHSALYWNTTGEGNVATGWSALEFNTTGLFNTATGYGALNTNTSGTFNVATGHSALLSNTTGFGNVATGSDALGSNTSGCCNVATGLRALIANTTGSENVATGSEALEYNTTGNRNVAVGQQALEVNVTGSFNTAVGYLAAQSGGVSGVSLSNTGAFGYAADPTASNTIVLGNTAITSIGGAVAWSNLSDGRYKTNVRENVAGLEFIKKLRPVTFHWDLGKLNTIDGAEEFASDGALGEAREAKAAKVHTGFIAQEVEAAANECGFDFSGVVKPANEASRYQLAYGEFVVPLVKAVQEQQREIEELREAVQVLQRRANVPRRNIGEMSTLGVLGDSWAGVVAMLGAFMLFLRVKHSRALPRP